MLSYAMTSRAGDREYNEDNICVEIINKEACFVLTDGLGGQGNGAMASKYVTEYIKNEFVNSIGQRDENFINYVIAECQKGLLRIKENEDSTSDMMTTVVLLILSSKKMYWGHVGDSRLYRFENGRLVERTLDHSVPQMLASSGEIEESEIRHHVDRNRLLRAIGMSDKTGKLNSCHEMNRTVERQAFLLCSDGFWEYIEEGKMEKALNRSKTPQQWLRRMTEIVKKNGSGNNMDNYSAICVFLES